MTDVIWKCKTCGSWWMHGDAKHDSAPRRCYGECGGTEFERREVTKGTVETQEEKAP